ncbi:DUF1697 domain-containing protein [Nocardioides sp. GY 10113]|uniref:DUF1697 domain-containing protein n=1 Tax=Nocardioides sp. GY 10113 TaxID=2569761 RepID=UPI0010A940D4|nr:DUF1697 domain-containing protein [Nocardioides sp. GY 10113]TIC87492.1 DUF1697 domain-containing protein [Nocardioides sp. GY 10113]
MTTYVAFLRAINLGATRKFPRAAIVAATEAAGFDGVATHINTGNVRLDTAMRSRARIESALEAAYRAEAGFEVPTIAFTAAELAAVAVVADALDHHGRHYVSLLKAEPTAATLAALEEAIGAAGVDGERVHVEGRAAHLLLAEGESQYHTAKLSNAFLERHLGVATNRNVTVVRTLVRKWC